MALTAEIIKHLESILGPDRVMSQAVDRLVYAFDSSFEASLNRFEPDVVVRPGRAEEVSDILKLAWEHGIPVTPRGAGTGQNGGAVAVQGGILLDLSGMNRILAYDLDNLQVLIEPGIVHAALNQALKPYGFFFPPDPGSSKMCTLGGMVSFNSSGMRAVKYGTTREYVLGLEVVLPDGQVIITGGLHSKALKTASGYELTRLFVGAEGTLGVITKIRLKVLPLPEKRGLVLATFQQVEDSGRAVIEVFRRRLTPSAIEILDDSAMQAAMAYKEGLSLPKGEAMLLFEVDGTPADVAFQAERIADTCRELASHVDWSDDHQRVADLWEARSLVGAAASRVKAGTTRVYDGEDICVPIARVPEALRRIREIGRSNEVVIVTYGHIGDGNLHAAPVVDTRNPAEVERVKRVVEAIHRLALELEGTTTGEHGVGLSRARYMEEEHGPALEVMRTIKGALDPRGIMNPGKMGL
ncbi:MAG: FAD-binding protein [Firmicutes bacterium]|nr:FAD-binding protein [Bacillota bacterium]